MKGCALLDVCSCFVVLECRVPCTVWKEAAADGWFSVWRSTVHLPPCHKKIKICAVLNVYERQRRTIRMEPQTNAKQHRRWVLSINLCNHLL